MIRTLNICVLKFKALQIFLGYLKKKYIYMYIVYMYWLRGVNDTAESDSAVLMQTKQSFFYHTAVSATANLLIFIMTSGSI